ncbi:hypothetical protein AOQ84DRAFT_131338 [Glonium stellatum]|uniref:DUF6594 domain-containing protein n=1 Tax=Glonium stellatum TaxID=574774 RepID=A0A8E2F9S4_9PEZI|nr:hypothetical protein AOQ84DRAFT_131338 [Glonium stellatum]
MNQARQQGPQPIQQPRPQQPAPQAVPPPVQPRIQHQHQYVPQQPAQQPPLVHRHTFHEPGRDLRRHNPARYLGYRVFSKWVASDQTYFIVRKFPALNVRVILSLQDEIVKLEQELNTLDEDWSRERLPGGIQHPDPDTIHNGTFRQDDVQERTELIERLTKKLKNYSRTNHPIFHLLYSLFCYLSFDFFTLMFLVAFSSSPLLVILSFNLNAIL